MVMILFERSFFWEPGISSAPPFWTLTVAI
jgi:hypothetical protein